MIELSRRSSLRELQEVGRSWWIRVALAALIVLSIGVLAGLRINVSHSLPVGLYRVVGETATVNRGSVVVVCLPDAWNRFALRRKILGQGHCDGGSYGIGKIVLAVGGDTVELRHGGLTVNGQSIPNSRPMEWDRYGRRMPRYPSGRYTLKAAEVWLFSPHIAAFDSRYFGPVSTSRIRSVVGSVWTTRRHTTAVPRVSASPHLAHDPRP